MIEDVAYEYNLTTRTHKDALHVEAATHGSYMPEYPQTSDGGYLYVISTSGLPDEQVLNWHQDVRHLYISFI